MKVQSEGRREPCQNGAGSPCPHYSSLSLSVQPPQPSVRTVLLAPSPDSSDLQDCQKLTFKPLSQEKDLK